MRPVSIRVGAVGDISFEGPLADRPTSAVFADVQTSMHGHDVMVANLECVLTNEGDPIPGKCTLRGNPGWARALRDAGVDVVSLANNHAMDYGERGLADTMEALDEVGIKYVGAGRNAYEACAPLLLETRRGRVAFLARTAVFVSARTYATDREAGVAYFDLQETVAAVRSLRSQADLIVALIHWGLEEYEYPSPDQRAIARQLVDAGVDALIGHHPHVLQGSERYKSSIICYSLGNFVFNEFDWWLSKPGQEPTKVPSPLSEANRKSVIATYEWNTRGFPGCVETYTRSDADGRVVRDPSRGRARDAHKRNAALQRRCYQGWWRLYAIRREWSLRLGEHLATRRIVSNLHRVRPRHVIDLVHSLRRSARIVAEKSTSPYQ
jgi:hypothetical protein